MYPFTFYKIAYLLSVPDMLYHAMVLILYFLYGNLFC